MLFQILLSGFLGLIPLVMLVILLIIKRKSGRNLMKVKSLEAISLFVLGVICFAGCLYIICFNRNGGNLFYTIPLFLVSIYFISYTIVSRNSITEKGIIILEPSPHLLKWDDIQRFGIRGKRIYFEKKKGCESIVVFNQDPKDFEKVISANICKGANTL